MLLDMNSTFLCSNGEGILDTGTTFTLLSTASFQAYQNVTGGVPDSNTGLLKITQQQYNKLKNLNFDIGGVTYSLTPNA